MPKNKSKVNKWTSGQDNFLRENRSTLADSEIADLMGRTVGAVNQRARQLGLIGKNASMHLNDESDERAKKFSPEPEKNIEQPIKEPVPSELPDKERWAEAEARRNKSRESLTNLGALDRQKLAAPPREGFRRYWANDDSNRLADMLNKGYDFVRKGSIGSEDIFSDDRGDKISQLVGMTKTNKPMRAYLMEIPEGWHIEDLEKREARRRTVEKDIKRAAHGGGQSRSADGSSVMYIPTQGSSHFDV